MTETTDRLGIPILEGNQAQKHVTANEAFQKVEDTIGQGYDETKGSFVRLKTVSETLTLSGGSVTSTVEFPDQCIILAVSMFVKSDVTGASSFDIGDGTTVDRFGDALGLSQGVTNQGVISPAGNYSALPVVVTANGSNFGSGILTISLHYLEIQPPNA